VTLVPAQQWHFVHGWDVSMTIAKNTIVAAIVIHPQNLTRLRSRPYGS
jgi:hypothetical protein